MTRRRGHVQRSVAGAKEEEAAALAQGGDNWLELSDDLLELLALFVNLQATGEAFLFNKASMVGTSPHLKKWETEVTQWAEIMLAENQNTQSVMMRDC